MIDPQTVLVAVAACVVIVAVWAWGIVREDGAELRGFDAGRLVGAAEERRRARRADPAQRPDAKVSTFGAQLPLQGSERPADASLAVPAPSTLSAGAGEGHPGATTQREIPAWLRTPGGSGERNG